MSPVYIASDNIISPLGFSTTENISGILNNRTGIIAISDNNISPVEFFASVIDNNILTSKFESIDDPGKFTRFEQLALLSVKDALAGTSIDPKSKKTLFILSTTKGNIDLLEENKKRIFVEERLFLSSTAKLISGYFCNQNTPVVVSNACISGVLAITVASRLIRAGKFENVVVSGADIISKFVVSGFMSFQSLSTGPCRPFDSTRDGLSLGEGCGTIILTSNPDHVNIGPKIMVGGGSSNNDANHISGPSRTGEGLLLAINNTLSDTESAGAGDVGFISAHGTATLFNDEMESIAITRAGMENIPVNSLKGYWGHTLGAAGVIESIATIYSLKNDIVFKTAGFTSPGSSRTINVCQDHKEQNLNACLKLASGFGGSNAGIIFFKG